MLDRRQFIASTAAAWCLAADAVEASNIPADDKKPPDYLSRGDEIVKIVRDHFFDAKKAAEWAKVHAGFARAVASEEGFTRVTRDALATLNASHTAYYTPSDARYYGLAAIFGQFLNGVSADWDSPGIDFSQDGFVRRLFAGGPGAKAGLRRGDKVLSSDGRPFHPVESFQGKANRVVSLEVQRTRNAPPIAVEIVPRRMNAKTEWLQAQKSGTVAIVHGGKRIVYAPYFSGAGEEHQAALKESILRFGDADAMVLDFRDGFGGCNPEFLNLFNRKIPALEQIDRGGKGFRFESAWRKPLVLLINEGSSSGKEIVAHAMKKHRIATLVGKKTAGAVLGGRCFVLSNRSLLYLAVGDVRVDGERLEGRGVEPDVVVEEALPFADGADPQLEAALEVAASLKMDGTNAR